MTAPRILLTGASGHLGAFLLKEARRRDLNLTAWTGRSGGEFAGFPLSPINLTDADAVASAFTQARPEVVLHAAALSAIADCHRDPELARRINTEATEQLATQARTAGARFIYISTDLVFDGSQGRYKEGDPPRPLSVYAHTKLTGEAAVRELERGLVVRVAWLAGPKLLGAPRFFDDLVRKLRAGEPVTLFEDEFRSPLGLPTAAAALWDLALSDVAGLLHLGGPERLSRFEMGLQLARYLRVSESLVRPMRQAELPAPEPRPADVSLNSSRWRGLFPQGRWATYAETLGEVLG